MTKINEPELLSRLTDLFRTYGYDRASLSKISEVTGLGRSSLYHRFPGGKAEMADAVLTAADEWLGEYVLAPLEEPGDPSVRGHYGACAGLDQDLDQGHHCGAKGRRTAGAYSS